MATRLHGESEDMAQIIAILGNKGGTGKTTNAHLLCYGLGLLGTHSVCLLTDAHREPLEKGGRNYLPMDARTPDQLQKLIKKLSLVDGWLGIIDGGANNPEADLKLAAHADLVILPFRESHEDLRTVIADLERLPKALALPSQWPTNAWQRDAANRNVAALMSKYRPRLLEPLNAISASKLLLQHHFPDNIPTPLRNAARRFAAQVLDRLRLHYEQFENEPEDGEAATSGTPIASPPNLAFAAG
jgi:hypothetical protein